MPENEDQPPPDPDYSRIADLAEAVAYGISAPEPDWCQLATQADELAERCRARCQGLTR